MNIDFSFHLIMLISVIPLDGSPLMQEAPRIDLEDAFIQVADAVLHGLVVVLPGELQVRVKHQLMVPGPILKLI